MIVESFESLRELRGDLRVPIGQLVEPGAEVPVAEIAEYAQAVGAAQGPGHPPRRSTAASPPRPRWWPRPTRRACSCTAGRSATRRGSARWASTLCGELTAFFAAGVDGVFADSPDTAVAARRSWMMGR